jgi:hypothetical protein
MAGVMKRLSQSAVRLFLPLAIVVLIAGVAAACPTCREGLAENDPQGQGLAAGFFYSILLMMGMPFAILGTFGGMAYLSIRKARAAAAAATVVRADQPTL